MTATDLDPMGPVSSLTGALVESNDRLLGLLGLITADAPPSLDVTEMIDWVLQRAHAILPLDRVQISGAVEHLWGTPEASEHSWEDRPRSAEASDVLVTYGRNSKRFDTADTKLLAAVTALVANAIATAALHRVQLEQQLVSSEHKTAARITTMALPDPGSTPEVPGVSLFCDLVPARTTGGDLYTWREQDGELWFAMGDVSGKGLPAAVLMTSIVSLIDAVLLRSNKHQQPGQVVAEVERLMYHRLSDAAMFVTLALGRWSPTTGELCIFNNGHSPIVHVRDGRPQRVEAGAPPLGVIEGLLPEPWVTQTRPGDVLVLATDGFTEQPDHHGVMFGEDRFDHSLAIAAGVGESAGEIGETLLRELESFSAGCEQTDDRALMVVQFS